MIARLMGIDVITPRELLHTEIREQTNVYDVNSRASWESAHVPGATHLDPAAFIAGDLPADRTLRLVFYCSNSWCRKAPIAARRARAMGYANVWVMAAGITGWCAAGLPTDSVQESGRPAAGAAPAAIHRSSA
ncbi:MAG: rhodanese-like domain-containing protein [Gaiellaceae bacterium]